MHEEETRNDTELNLSPESSHNFQEVIDKYPGLKEYIDKIESTTEQFRKYVHGYLGSGSEKDSFRFDKLVVKTARHESGQFDENIKDARNMSEQATPLQIGANILRLEHLVAVDDESETMITTYMPGRPITEIPVLEIFTINKKHICNLVETLDQMRGLGLHPHNLGGIIYDIKNGFSFVDYELVDDDKVHNRGDISDVEGFIYTMLANPHRNSEHPGRQLRTTGVRALARGIVAQKFRQLQKSSNNH